MPIVMVLLWAILFLSFLSRNPARRSALAAFTLMTATMVLITEALSFGRLLAPLPLAAAWIAACLAAAVSFRRRIPLGVARLRELLKVRPDGWDVLTGLTLGALLTGTALSALLYPTTNSDSLTYHMPRVFFWLQNRSVAFYPTAEARQLFSAPLAEYFIANIQALSFGSDRLAGMVQWLSYVFGVLTVSLIARKLGASTRGQQVSAVVAATVPMAVLQASTTQNDLTSATWCLVAIYAALHVIRPEGRNILLYAGWSGAAAALAVLAKAPAYLVVAPFFAWLAVAALRREGWRRSLSIAAVIGLSFAVLVGGTYIRNASALHGDFLAVSAKANSRTLVGSYDPASVLTAGMMNTAMLFGTPSDRLNALTERAVRGTVGFYGGDVASPSVNFAGFEGNFEIPATPTNHDSSPAAVTMVLIGVAAIVLLANKATRTGTNAAYVACAAAAFLLCAGLIAWQPWINRLLLPALMVLTPLVGPAYSHTGRDTPTPLRFVLGALIALGVFMGAFAMVFNGSNPLAPRFFQPATIPSRTFWNASYQELRFKQVPEAEEAFTSIAKTVQAEGIVSLGVAQETGNVPIYPLLALLPGVHVSYVGAEPLTPYDADETRPPQAIVEIVATDAYLDALEDGTVRGPRLTEDQRAGDLVILLYRAP